MRLNLCKITNKAKFTDPASITYIKKLTQHIVSKVKFLSFAVCLFLAVMYLSLSILQKWKRLWVPDFLLFSSNSAFSAINSKQEYQTFNAFLLLATPGFSCVDPALGLVILLFLFHFQKQGLCSLNYSSLQFIFLFSTSFTIPVSYSIILLTWTFS